MQPPNPIRIQLVEDHSIVRAGLRMLIESHPGLIVVGEAANGAEALALAESRQPDIILLDLGLGQESGLDLLPRLQSVAGRARVILLTGVRDPEQHRRAVRLGAMGVVLKEEAAQVLLDAVQKVHAGEVWLDPSMVASMLGELSRPRDAEKPDPEAAKLASLSERECEIIALLCQGMPNKQVASELSISEVTVRYHLGHIYQKLGVEGRLELVIYAFRHGLAKPK
jgi:two-component system nitrate/nitrite response regulator NarL